MPYDPDDIVLAEKMKALAHPARLAIVRALLQADRCCCGDIVVNLPLAQSTVSQHLKVLRRVGLIHGDIDGPRSCYWLDRDALAAIEAAMAAFNRAARQAQAAQVEGPQ